MIKFSVYSILSPSNRKLEKQIHGIIFNKIYILYKKNLNTKWVKGVCVCVCVCAWFSNKKIKKNKEKPLRKAKSHRRRKCCKLFCDILDGYY